MTLSLLSLIVALILAVLAAFNVASTRVGLFPLSFAFFLLSLVAGSGVLR